MNDLENYLTLCAEYRAKRALEIGTEDVHLPPESGHERRVDIPAKGSAKVGRAAMAAYLTLDADIKKLVPVCFHHGLRSAPNSSEIAAYNAAQVKK